MLPVMRFKNPLEQKIISSFGGINIGFGAKENHLSHAQNMTSADFPALSSRPGYKSFYSAESQIDCAEYFGKLYTVEYQESNERFYLCFDDEKLLIPQAEYDGSKHRIFYCNGEIFILPEKVTCKLSDHTFKSCHKKQIFNIDNSREKYNIESDGNGSMPYPYNTWILGELSPNSIRSMSATYRVSSSYTFYHLSVDSKFEIGDIVTLKMDAYPQNTTQNEQYHKYVQKMANGISAKISSFVKTSHSTPTGTKEEITEIVFENNSIDMGGYSDVVITSLTMEKTIPDIVDACVFENRIWAVSDSSICTSKLGDASVWNDFGADSYGTLPMSCFECESPTSGKFTSIVPYNGNIIAFKEDSVCKVYGDSPAEYTISSFNADGVEAGCERTVNVIGSLLYYKSKKGITVYNGASTQQISNNVLDGNFDCEFANTDGRYYYAAITYRNTPGIYVYDTFNGCRHLWTLCDTPTDFAKIDRELAIVCQNDIYTLCQNNEQSISEDGWDFGLSLFSKDFGSKHIRKIRVHYILNEKSSFEIRLSDKNGTYTVGILNEPVTNGIYEINLPVYGSDEIKLDFSGKGKFTLTALDVCYSNTSLLN